MLWDYLFLLMMLSYYLLNLKQTLQFPSLDEIFSENYYRILQLNPLRNYARHLVTYSSWYAFMNITNFLNNLKLPVP